MEMKNNEQHAIDIKVKQALENLEMPYNADHWTDMVGRLEALDSAEADFDAHVAEKIGQIGVPFMYSNWEALSTQLDALDAEETHFDKHIAEKLSPLTVPFVPSNWDDMATRLNDLDKADAGFDNILRSRLDNLRVTMPENHWDLMAEKIEENFSWRRRIVRYKVVEVALILFTLFTVGNMLDLPFDTERSTDNAPKTSVEKAQKEEVKKTRLEKTKETKSFYNPTDWRNRPAIPENNPNPKQNALNKPIVALDNAPLQIVPNATVAPFITHLGTQSSESAILPTVSTTDRMPMNGLAAIVHTSNQSRNGINTEGGVTAKIEMKKVLALGYVVGENAFNKDVTDIFGSLLLPMDILKPSLLNTDFYDENIVFPRTKEKKAKWRLNVFGLPGIDWVTTNYILDRKKKSQSQWLPNLGAGVAASFRKGKWEAEAGLTYLDKKYDLPNVEVISGNFRTKYTTEKPENLHLSILSIPLSINYTAKATHHWSFYARAGVAFNAILKTDESQFVTSSDPNALSAQKPLSLDVFEGNTYPKGISEKGFFKIDNWFKGGLKSNTYLTAQAGIGIEYRLTHNTDIYLQPTFDYHFSNRGIGNLNDHIHALNIQGGVKTKLK